MLRAVVGHNIPLYCTKRQAAGPIGTKHTLAAAIPDRYSFFHDQVRLLRRHLRRQRVAKPEQRLYLTLIQHTVARVREINRLTWDDVHEDYVVLGTRKARNSDLTERKIPLTDTAKAVLAQIPKTSDCVFMNPRTGRAYDYRKRLMRSLCQRAGVRYFSFHAFRHLLASILSKEGVALTDIQRVLGHQRATTTDIYLRSIGALSSAMQKLERPK